MKFTKLFLILILFFLVTAEECEDKTIRQVVIAPNPANDHIKLSFILTEDSDLNISVADINGNTVLESTNNMNFRAGENEYDISTGSLINGTYLIVIKSSKDIVSQKLIVLH